jgi:hypothetical protein
VSAHVRSLRRPGFGSQALDAAASGREFRAPRHFGGDSGPQRVDNAGGFDSGAGVGFANARRVLRAARDF